MGIKNAIKTTKGKVILGIVGGMVVGSMFSGASTEQIEAVENVKKLTAKVEELEVANTELNNKVKEAEPFFKMEEDKRVAEAEKAKAEREKLEKENIEKQKKEEAKAREAKTKKLGNGNFVSGEDFEEGTYDIVAVKGGGNVISSNAMSGGINAILGTEAKIKESESIGMKDFYKKEYKNIKLPKGTTLKIDGVEIKLIPKE